MKRTLLIIPVTAVIALAGCGGDDSGEQGTAAAGETVDVSLVDFAIEPKTIHLDAAGTYTFHATNNGQAQHALEIEGGDVGDETDTLSPGDSGDVTVELAVGDYEIYCPIDGHRAQGMEGDLVVGSTGGAGATTEDENETSTGGGAGYGYP